MRTSTGIALTLATAIGLGTVTMVAKIAAAEDSAAQSAYRDIEQTLGSVPSFFKAFPESGRNDQATLRVCGTAEGGFADQGDGEAVCARRAVHAPMAECALRGSHRGAGQSAESCLSKKSAHH